jgi:hypothetical protein
MRTGLVGLAVGVAVGFHVAHSAVAQTVPEIFVSAAAGSSLDLFETFEQYQESLLPSGTAAAEIGMPLGPAPASGFYGKASTVFGQNAAGAFVRGQGELAVSSFSYWTDLFTPTGGSGMDTATTSVTLTGTIDPGLLSVAVYALFVSSTPLNDDEKLLAALEEVLLGLTPTDPQAVISTVVSNFDVTPITAVGTYSFTYGVPFYFASVLGTFAGFDAGVDLLNTADFGITAPGTLMTGSGTVYANAVPEPGTWAMMFAGLALLAFVARRRVARA